MEDGGGSLPGSDKLTHPQAYIAHLEKENARLRQFVEAQATCGCCGEVQECKPECTMADDDPDHMAFIDTARSALAPG